MTDNAQSSVGIAFQIGVFVFGWLDVILFEVVA